MRPKILGLFVMTALVAVMFMSLGSATACLNLTEVSVPSQVYANDGELTVSFTLSNRDTCTVEKELNWSITSNRNDYGTWDLLGLPTLVDMENLDANPQELSATFTFDDTIPVGEMTTTIHVDDGVDDGDTDEFDLLLNSITIILEPIEFNFCEYDGGVSENPGELKVSIDITVIEGFGDDEEWLPLDKIEVEIDVENKGEDYDVDDISLEWGIYNSDTNEWAIEMDEEDEFNLKDGDEEKFTITFTVDDSDFDLDLDELGEYYTLYVRATGEVDDTTNPKTCASDSEDIQIIIESDFVILNDLKVLPETVQCGSEFQITADVWNIGDDDQDDVSIVISNKELGINKVVEVGDIDAFEDEKLDTLVSIPSDAEERSYVIKLSVYDDDHDVYENDYDEEESVFSVPLKVEGNCIGELPVVSVLTSLESDARAGKDLVVKVTVTNTGTESVSLILNAEGYAEWALSSDYISDFSLNAGDSKDVLFTFETKDDLEAGEYGFNIEVLSGTEVLAVQPVNVMFEKKGWSITGAVVGEGAYVWGLIIVDLILLILIIVVAVKVARK